MTKNTFPSRLHVLIASKSDQAIVIRRGPSKFTCIVSWNRTKNTFEVSQWLKGRIYERRSDISPSGKHWLYFAMNGKRDSETKGSWTAIANSPWLKAITLFAKGDCWNGGGLFLDDHTFWLNDGYGHNLLFDSRELTKNADYSPPAQYGGECPSVYYNRLQRDGWNLKERQNKVQLNSVTIFEKSLASNWILRKICHEQVGSPVGKGCYWDEHEIENSSGSLLRKPDWEWADWIDGSITYAEGGCLYKIDVTNTSRLDDPQLLHDFNGYRFEKRPAPY